MTVENAVFAEQSLGLNAERENLLAKRNDLQADLEAALSLQKMPLIEEIKTLAQTEADKLRLQIADIDRQLAAMPEFVEPENPLKNAEMEVEGNFNMIDGVINNGANLQEIAGIYDDVERAADEKARTKLTAEQMISALENEGKLNPDFYKSLSKEDRNVSQSLTMENAKKVITDLAAQNIDFSAVVRKNGMVAITTNRRMRVLG